MSDLKLYPAWRQVESELMARGMQDGETIPMDYLRAGFGVQDPRTMTDGIEVLRQQALFNFSLGELKASLLENHRVQLRLVEGVGYMVVPPSDQTRLSMKDRGAEIVNAITKAEREVTYIREDGLTESQRKENTDARARMGHLKSIVRKRIFQLPP